MLTDEELGLLRDEVEAWMPDLLDIYRTTETEDPYGGSGTIAEALLSSGVRCAIESGAAHEQTRAFLGKIAGNQIFSVSLPADTDIRVTDHVVITTREDLHLRVQAVLAPESWEMERRVVASELGEHIG